MRPLNHLQACAALAVLDFVHDVVDQQYAAPRRLEQVRRVARIGNLAHVKTVAFVFDREDRFVRRQFRGDPQQLGRIVSIAVLDRVHKGFVEGDEQV